MIRSLKDKLKSVQVYMSAALTATANTASVDLADCNSLMWLVSVGTMAFSGTDKLSLKVQHSDDDSNWVDAVAADIHNAEDGDNGIAKILDSASEDEMTHAVHYRGNKRYARLQLVEDGTVSVPCAVVAVMGHQELMPPL